MLIIQNLATNHKRSTWDTQFQFSGAEHSRIGLPECTTYKQKFLAKVSRSSFWCREHWLSAMDLSHRNETAHVSQVGDDDDDDDFNVK